MRIGKYGSHQESKIHWKRLDNHYYVEAFSLIYHYCFRTGDRSGGWVKNRIDTAKGQSVAVQKAQKEAIEKLLTGLENDVRA